MKFMHIFVLAALLGMSGKAPAAPGLTAHGATLLKDGRPVRAIGANYFDLFGRVLKNPEDHTSLDGLERLARAGIPFVRFRACGFWPVEWDLYLKDKPEYFARMDRVVRAAERDGIGLIPSLFWTLATVPDVVGEPLDQLGNPQSKTAAFIRQYTAEVVGRYKDSPAIWGWEMGNEYNLAADLPNAAEHRPPVLPRLKTAASRSARDELSSAQMVTAFKVFAEAVRKVDPSRIIVTGNSVPRPGAWHNTAEKSWKRDTPEQFRQVLLRDNPAPIDTVTVHLYPGEGRNEAYPAGAKTLDELVALAQADAAGAGRPLFIGEFGASRQMGEKSLESFKKMLAAIEQHHVALAAFWVFDLKMQDKDWNVTFENERKVMIELTAAANRRLNSTPNR